MRVVGRAPRFGEDHVVISADHGRVQGILLEGLLGHGDAQLLEFRRYVVGVGFVGRVALEQRERDLRVGALGGAEAAAEPARLLGVVGELRRQIDIAVGQRRREQLLGRLVGLV